ncbi:transposase (plasmid) [Rossellomorea sp. AcN35-11]|nr:transposase [Rossellomorea aquimaris]WJV31966.1 transposase [Rossellomorea sp. AcN35-11]
MREKLVEAIYQSIVKENLVLYKHTYESTKVNSSTDEHWKSAITLFDNLNPVDKEVMLRIVEQTMIDTISNVLGLIDGSSTLEGEVLDFKVLLNEGAEGGLQDIFLELIENQNE